MNTNIRNFCIIYAITIVLALFSVDIFFIWTFIIGIYAMLKIYMPTYDIFSVLDSNNFSWIFISSLVLTLAFWGGNLVIFILLFDIISALLRKTNTSKLLIWFVSFIFAFAITLFVRAIIDHNTPKNMNTIISPIPVSTLSGITQ